MKAVKRALVEVALENVNLYDDTAKIREDYSGRGMYGQTCFGVTFARNADSYKFLAAMAILLAKEGADHDDPYATEDDAYEFAEATCTDSMGLGMIAYFPGYTLES